MRGKVAMLVLVPLCLLGAVGVQGLREAGRTSAAMDRMVSVMDLCGVLSALVHETQKERGFTAGYLGSSGRRFASELTRQHGQVDERAQALDVMLTGLDLEDLGPEIAAALASARSELEQVTSVRGRVSAQQISLDDALGYYTQMNAKFLNAVGEARNMPAPPRVSREVGAYAEFLLGKERAGIERAVLSSAFARDSFLSGGYAKLVRLISEQNTYFDSFYRLSSDAVRSDFDQCTDRADAGVASFRDAAHARSATGGFGQDAGAWFAAATARINALKQVDDDLAASISETAHGPRPAGVGDGDHVDDAHGDPGGVGGVGLGGLVGRVRVG